MSVRTVLIDGKVLYTNRFCISNWSNKKNPDKYNNLVASNTSSAIPAQQSQSLNIEDHKDMILDESKRLYDILVKHFTNTIMDNADGTSSSNSTVSLSSSSTFTLGSYNQDDIYKRDDPEIYHDSKADIAPFLKLCKELINTYESKRSS